MRRLALLAAATAAFLTLTAASCQTLQPFAGTGQPKLGVVGDSITVFATPDLNAAFGSSYDVGIHALVGAGVDIAVGEIAQDAAASPAAEVINLGTNDAPYIANGGETVAHVDGMLDQFAAEFPASSCVVFVTIDSHNPSWGPAQAAAINDHLRSTFPHVADWDAALTAADFDGPDSPHPNETGRQALVALIAATVAGCSQ